MPSGDQQKSQYQEIQILSWSNELKHWAFNELPGLLTGLGLLEL